MVAFMTSCHKILTRRNKAITLFEVVIATALFTLLMLAAYRLFFAEVRAIRSALEHVGVNESARRFFANFGNDIRNSNWVDYPIQTHRETVPALMAISEGKLCVLRRQVFDFSVKPPDPAFLKEETIEYHLRPADDGTSDLYRIVSSDISGKLIKYERMICDGIRDMLVHTTIRKPAIMTTFAPGLPFKNLIRHEPYELDGHGPYLVHVRASFVRKGATDKTKIAHSMRTSFALRGRLNGVHP